jgi:hypothetical protein
METSMKKILIVLLGLSLIGASGCGSPSQPNLRTVDLNVPGSMAALARSNPDHHAKIQRILVEVQQQEPRSVSSWMKAEFGADQVQYMPLLKASDPARRFLAFTLDNMRYEVVLVEARTPWSIPKQ